ncbi:MAG: hypothetical protein ACQESN_05275 [Thermotogota bacterium]
MKKVLLFSLMFLLIFIFYSCAGLPNGNGDGDGDTTGTTEFTISDFDGTSKTEAESLLTANSNDPAANAAMAIFETEEFLTSYVRGLDEDFSDAATYLTNISEAASELSYIFGSKEYGETDYYSGPKDDIEEQITIIYNNLLNIKSIVSSSEIASYLATLSGRLNKIVAEEDINIIMEQSSAGYFMNIAMVDNLDMDPESDFDASDYIPSNGIAFDYRDFMTMKMFVDGIINVLDEQVLTTHNRDMIIEFAQISYGFEYTDLSDTRLYFKDGSYTFETDYVNSDFIDDAIYFMDEFKETGELEAFYKLDSGTATPTVTELESDFSVIYDRVSPNDGDSTKVSMTDIIHDNMILTPNISNFVTMVDMILENLEKVSQFEGKSKYQNRERVNFMEANIHMMDIIEGSTATTVQKQNFKMSEMKQMPINNETGLKLNSTVITDSGDIMDILRNVLPSGILTISDDEVVMEEDYMTGDPILLGDLEITIDFGGISTGMDLADFNMYVESGFSSPLAELLLMQPYDGTDINSNFVPEVKNLIDEINGVSYTGDDVEVEISFGSDFSYNMYIYDLLNETTLIDLFEN